MTDLVRRARFVLALSMSALAACGARNDLELEAAAAPDAPEACNGRDDDGDGLVDEDLGEIACGAGACRRTAPACRGGAPGACEPGPPGAEVCNGADDDCDGATDEGLGLVRVGGPHLVDPGLTYLARTTLVPTDEGFFAVYATSFDGTNPTPNVRLARLDADGAPASAPEVLTSRNMTNGPRLSPSPDGWVTMYCGRFGFNDRAASGVVAPGGAFTEHGERSPVGKNCGAGDPDAIWTGERLLFGWTDNGVDNVYLDRAAADGVSAGGAAIDEGGDLSSMPRFAVADGRVVMIYGRREPAETSWLRVRVLDPGGDDLAESVDIAPPIEGGQWKEAQIAGHPGGGFLVLGANRFDPGWFRVRLDPSGAVIAADVLPDADFYVDVGATLSPRPGAGYLAAGIAIEEDDTYYGFVMALDAAGNITDRWTTLDDPVEPLFGWPSIAVRDGRIFVAYSSYDVPDTNFPELRVIELGCGGR